MSNSGDYQQMQELNKSNWPPLGGRAPKTGKRAEKILNLDQISSSFSKNDPGNVSPYDIVTGDQNYGGVLSKLKSNGRRML